MLIREINSHADFSVNQLESLFSRMQVGFMGSQYDSAAFQGVSGSFLIFSGDFRGTARQGVTEIIRRSQWGFWWALELFRDLRRTKRHFRGLLVCFIGYLWSFRDLKVV